jgi:DNA-binding winged helix-turn-helix (wHTH) protein
VIFRFGPFELDEQAGELRRNGVPVSLQPKPFALLALLIARRDRIVPLEEIFAALWPDTVVTPSSLTRAASHARRAIGDTHQGTVLRSFPRRGYRFCTEVAVVNPAIAAPGARGPSTQQPFVGRTEALAVLDRAWARAASGEGAIALISGPAGIGKTRLAEVFAEGVRARGGLVCLGRARDGEGVPAFWVFTQILRALLVEPSLAEEVRALGAHARHLAGLLPELTDDPTVAPAGADAEGSRFLFFDAVSRVLTRCAQRRPLVLVLEDLQWVGSASLRLLEHIAFELASQAVLVVATLRNAPRERGHPLNATLAALGAQDRCEHIRLGRLSRADVAALLRQVVGGPVPADFTSELLARTEGVPLFLREALRVLGERGELQHPERTPRGLLLSGRTLELIQRALEALSAPSAELVGAAAVLGREFTLQLVAGVLGVERADALERLEEAVRAGLLEPQDHSGASYRFAHALHQEAAYASLASGLRARLHLRAAELLEQQCADDFERIAAELADHHHRALAVGNAERAFAFAMCAAERAARVFAYEQAALHYQQAAAALEHVPAVDPRRWLATQLALGEAYRLAGDRTRRREVFGLVLQRARELERPREFARAAVGFCDITEWSPRDEVAHAALRDALADLADAGDDVLRASLLSRLAYLELNAGGEAEALSRRAVEVARRAAHAGPLQDALYTLHYAISGPDRLVERHTLARELAKLGRESGARDPAVIAQIDSACDCLTLGDARGARDLRAEAAAVAGAAPTPAMVWHMRVYDTGLALLEGRLDDVSELAQDAHLLGQRIGHPYAQSCFNAHRIGLARERGAFDEVLELVPSGLEGIERQGLTIPDDWIGALVARALLAVGRRSEAAARFEQLAVWEFDLPRDLYWCPSLIELAHLCADLGDALRAERLLPLLEPVAHYHGVLPVPICYGGPVSHALARLLELLGRHAEADDVYGAAHVAAGGLGAGPTRARILADHARLLAKRDPRRAADLADESRALASSLGLGPLGG